MKLGELRDGRYIFTEEEILTHDLDLLAFVRKRELEIEEERDNLHFAWGFLLGFLGGLLFIAVFL